MSSPNPSMHSRQVSDNKEDEVRYSRFNNERKQGEEKEYRKGQWNSKRQMTQDWLEEKAMAEANGEEPDVEEEVAVELVVRAKKPTMFPQHQLDGF